MMRNRTGRRADQRRGSMQIKLRYQGISVIMIGKEV